MLQLVYISTSRSIVTPELLGDVLEASRRNNTRAGITGLLVTGGQRFLQVLEGPEAAVLATYARIQADPRHFACVLLSCREVQARAFGEWAMGHQAGRDCAGAEDVGTVVARLVEPLSDKNLRAQFTGFAELHARAA